MKRTFLHLFFAGLLALGLTACTGEDVEAPVNRRVVLMYAAAFNNLSSYISEDIDELCAGNVPALGSGDILLVYSHLPVHSGVFGIATSPVLFRAYRDAEGHNRKDTLVIYPDSDISSRPETLRKVLNDVAGLFPARHYGMIVSSHAKGWIPAGYSEPSSSIFGIDAGPHKEYPPTKELCIENVQNSGIEMTELNEAIPFKLDFLIIDACLMACVETAYEVKDKVDFFVASPTEVLSNGLMYTTMAPLLTNTAEPDLRTVCEQYFNYYLTQTGYYQSATITMVDCRKLDALASACKAIIDSRRDVMASMDRNAVQKYFYNSFHWFYDLRDLLAKTEPSSAQLEELDRALSDCILYCAYTEKFFDVELKNICGLSMYYPIPTSTELNKFYKQLSWNKATGLIQ